MSFVSYAQNNEDVMLWRALRGIERGFYIDVGAQDPELDSVTLAFYERGWRGVNVEPVPAFCDALRRARPQDVTLGVAVGAAPGTGELFVIPGTGLSTLDPAVAELQTSRGWKAERLSVPVVTLAELCRAHAPDDIHFLKIDVEGGEEAALRGADFGRYRPWIVLVEATRPNSREENWAAWETLLLNAGYRFVWFDGLNRFYVAVERDSELAPHFRVPPNVYDQFARHDPEAARQRHALLADLTALRHWNAQASQQLAKLREEVAALREADSRAPEAPAAAVPAPSAVAADAPPGPEALVPHPARPGGRLRRALRPIAREARAFLTTEVRGEIAALQATLAAQATAIGALQSAQEQLIEAVSALAAAPQAPPPLPEEWRSLARAAESALLSIAVAPDQPNPSAAHSRSA